MMSLIFFLFLVSLAVGCFSLFLQTVSRDEENLYAGDTIHDENHLRKLNRQ